MTDRRSGFDRRTHRTGLDLVRKDKPTAPKSSYWAGCTRDELRTAIGDRRSQQRIPTESEMHNDPMLEATTALSQDHWKEKRVGR